MATISMPAGPGFVSVKPIRGDIVGIHESPFTGQRQVQAHAGKPYRFTVQLPPMQNTDSYLEDWIEFLDDLASLQNNFSFNLSPYLPGITGLSGKLYQLDQPGIANIDINTAFHFGLSITFREVVT